MAWPRDTGRVGQPLPVPFPQNAAGPAFPYPVASQPPTPAAIKLLEQKQLRWYGEQVPAGSAYATFPQQNVYDSQAVRVPYPQGAIAPGPAFVYSPVRPSQTPVGAATGLLEELHSFGEQGLVGPSYSQPIPLAFQQAPAPFPQQTYATPAPSGYENPIAFSAPLTAPSPARSATRPLPQHHLLGEQRPVEPSYTAFAQAPPLPYQQVLARFQQEYAATTPAAYDTPIAFSAPLTGASPAVAATRPLEQHHSFREQRAIEPSYASLNAATTPAPYDAPIAFSAPLTGPLPAGAATRPLEQHHSFREQRAVEPSYAAFDQPSPLHFQPVPAAYGTPIAFSAPVTCHQPAVAATRSSKSQRSDDEARRAITQAVLGPALLTAQSPAPAATSSKRERRSYGEALGAVPVHSAPVPTEPSLAGATPSSKGKQRAHREPLHATPVQSAPLSLPPTTPSLALAAASSIGEPRSDGEALGAAPVQSAPLPALPTAPSLAAAATRTLETQQSGGETPNAAPVQPAPLPPLSNSPPLAPVSFKLPKKVAWYRRPRGPRPALPNHATSSSPGKRRRAFTPFDELYDNSDDDEQVATRLWQQRSEAHVTRLEELEKSQREYTRQVLNSRPAYLGWLPPAQTDALLQAERAARAERKARREEREARHKAAEPSRAALRQHRAWTEGMLDQSTDSSGSEVAMSQDGETYADIPELFSGGLEAGAQNGNSRSEQQTAMSLPNGKVSFFGEAFEASPSELTFPLAGSKEAPIDLEAVYADSGEASPDLGSAACATERNDSLLSSAERFGEQDAEMTDAPAQLPSQVRMRV